MKLKHDHKPIECEDAVIGICIFLGGAAFNEAKQLLKGEHIFYNYDNATIFKAMNQLNERFAPIDILTVKNECLEFGDTVGGDSWSYTVGLKLNAFSCPNESNLRQYCLILIEHYMKRERKKAMAKMGAGGDELEIANELNEILRNATDVQKSKTWKSMTDLVHTLLERRKKIADGVQFGVMTGFAEVDSITDGIQTGFHVIAARPAMGKTSFAVSMITNMVRQGIPVGLISLEMPDVQVGARVTAILTGVPFYKIFRNKSSNESERLQIDELIKKCEDFPLYTFDKTKVNAIEIRYAAEKLVRQKGAKCIIIDYLQLVDSSTGKKNDNREQEISKLAYGLNACAIDLDIPVIALAQLNRESETADKVSKRGKLSQLRESDSILAAASIGMIIDRPFKRGDITNEHGQSTEHEAYIDIQKHRNGEERLCKIKFNPDLMMFEDENNHSQFIGSIQTLPDSPKINRSISDPPSIKPFDTEPF